MSVQWKNELGEITRIDQFKIVPGMEHELLLACQQAIWANGKAWAIATLSRFDTFEQFMRKVGKYGGMMTGMNHFGMYPWTETHDQSWGMISWMEGEVDLQNCTITLYPPGEVDNTRSFGGAVMLPGFWFSNGTNDDGVIQVSLAPIYDEEVINEFPFASENLTPEQNAERLSTILALFIEDTQRLVGLSDKQWKDIVEVDWDNNNPPKIMLDDVRMTGGDLDDFLNELARTNRKFLQVKE